MWSFGTALQSEIDTAEAKKKHERGKKGARDAVFARWIPDAKADTTAQYRDPARDSPEGTRR